MMKLFYFILISFLVGSILYFVTKEDPSLKTTPSHEVLFKGPCDSLYSVIDSLERNYRIMEDNFMRYEATLDLLEEKNPEAAFEFENIYFDLYE
jgi:hypothetical protein